MKTGYSVGLIGLGRIGSQYDEGQRSDFPRSHTGALVSHPDFLLSGVADVTQDNLTKFENDWNLQIPKFEHPFEMLSSRNFDVVVIASPAETHLECIKAALVNGCKLILCEKPFCLNARQAQEAHTLAEAAGVPLVVNFHRTWSPKICAFRDYCRTLGRPERVVLTYGKGIKNYGSHIFRFLCDFFGPVRAVKSEFLADESIVLADPSLSGSLLFESGLVATLNGFDNVSYDLFDVEFYYSDRKITLEAGGFKIQQRLSQKDLYFLNYQHLGPVQDIYPVGPVHGLKEVYGQISQFLNNSSHSVESTSLDALHVWHIIDAFFASHQQRKEVCL